MNPVIEEVDNHEEDILKFIITRHGEERKAELDEEVMKEVAMISISEALSALKILQTYEEQQESGDPALTKGLRKRERELELHKTTELRQDSLKDWLGAK